MPLTTPVLIRFGVAQKVVSAATATGTGFSQQFCLPEGSGRYWAQMLIQGVLTGGFTAFVAALQFSLDGGVTFSTYTTHDLLATGGQVANLNGGSVIYRFNITSWADGTSGDIWVEVG